MSSRLPNALRKRLAKEAQEWEDSIAEECPQRTKELLDESEPFDVPRPPRQPVSLRMDPLDVSMLKRFARRKGIPYSQLMVMWLHERIEEERERGGE